MARRLDEPVGGLIGSADSVSARCVAPIVWLSRRIVTIFPGMSMTMGERGRSDDGTAGGRNDIGVVGVGSNMIRARVVEPGTVAATVSDSRSRNGGIGAVTAERWQARAKRRYRVRR